MSEPSVKCRHCGDGVIGSEEYKMCDYQGYEFGAGHYPDSVCFDGRLHDADSCDDDGNIYLQEEDIPCPVCREKDAIAWWASRNQLSGSSREDSLRAAKSLVADIRRNRGIA